MPENTDTTTRAVEAKLWTNHDSEAWPIEPMEGEPGVVDLERTDVNEIALHLRHVNDVDVTMSGYLTKQQAVELAFLLMREALS